MNGQNESLIINRAFDNLRNGQFGTKLTINHDDDDDDDDVVLGTSSDLRSAFHLEGLTEKHRF